MKEKITYSHLEEDLKENKIEEERKRLEQEKAFLQLVIHDKVTNSTEYKRIVEISKILNIKMIALSKEEQQQEIDEASKLITEREFDEISKSYNDEKKYVQLLKGYNGYDNEWKLYTRTNVD